MTPSPKVLTASLLLAVAVIALPAALATIPHRVEPEQRSPSAGAPSSSFRIKGSVGGLFPGRSKTIRARATNTSAFAIKVRRVTVTVRRPAPGCSPETLLVSTWRGSVRISPGATRRIRIPILMRASAPDACQGARYPLVYSGRAVRP